MPNPTLEQQLKQIGLYKNEITVYLALFGLGKCRAAKIMAATGLHRNLVYTSLHSLMKKNLVGRMEIGKVWAYEANQPSALVDMIENQKTLAAEIAEEMAERQHATPRDIKVYEGFDGVRHAHERSLALPPGEIVYILGGSQLSSTGKPDAIWEKYHRQRIKRKINYRILFDRTTPQAYVDQRRYTQRAEAKYLPFTVELPAWFEIFGDTLSIGVPGDEPVVFSLRNQEAADSLKKFFAYLWKQEVVVETGFAALRKAFDMMIDELNPGEEYWVLGTSTMSSYSDDIQTMFDEIHSRRIAKGVVVKMLSYRDYYARAKRRFSECGDPEGKVSFLKPIAGEQPRVPMQVNICRAKTVLIVHGTEPTVMYLEKPEVTDGFRAYFNSIWNQESYVLRGPEALRDLWLEGTESGEIRWIGARGYFIDRYPEFFSEIRKKSEQTPSLVWKNIVDRSVRGHSITRFPWSRTKYTPIQSNNPNVTWLFGDKMIISNWAEDEPVLFVSENKYLVQSQNDYFNDLWRRL